MIENLRARVVLTLIVIVMSFVSFFPNVIDMSNRWWFSSRKINFGLDIQGGLHVVMGVDTESVVREQSARFVRAVKEFCESDHIPLKAISTIRADIGEVKIELTTAAATESIAKFLDQEYRNAINVTDRSETELIIRYYEHYLTQLKHRIIEQAIETIRNRIDEFGVIEASITAQGDNRILIQLPGIKDAARAKELINRTARLDFMMLDESIEESQLQQWIVEAEKKGDYKLGKLPYSDYVAKINEDLKDKLPANVVVYFEKMPNAVNLEAGKVAYALKTDSGVNGDTLTDATVGYDQYNSPQVEFRFNPEGAKKFGDLTGKNVHKKMAIVLDRVVQSAPVINEKIGGGRGQITLGSGRDRNQTLDEAKLISMALRAGALPASLEQLEERTVGPSLGKDSIDKGRYAAIVGIILVFLAMVFYYRSFGVIADLALAINVLILLSTLTAIGATLTLPGIAGIALTVGMAVDANIIIFERIKEELAKGSSVTLAIKEGYERAFSAIFDSNVTTVAVCVVLIYYGTGPIRGFAVSLTIGLVSSMFTAIFVTRTILDVLTQKYKWTQLKIDWR